MCTVTIGILYVRHISLVYMTRTIYIYVHKHSNGLVLRLRVASSRLTLGTVLCP